MKKWIIDTITGFVRRRISETLDRLLPDERYQSHIALQRADTQSLEKQYAASVCDELVTVLMPVVDSDIGVDITISSLKEQSYANWQLVIAYDSVRWEIKAQDRRIRPVACGMDGDKLLRSAFAEIEGEYVLLISPGDTLQPDALYRLHSAISCANAAAAYGDEDRRDMDGYRFNPVFKPDFAYTALYGSNFVGRPFLMRTTDFLDSGYKRADPASEYALALTVCENKRVEHIAGVLYSRCQSLEPMLNDGRTVLEKQIYKTRLPAYAVCGLCRDTYRVRMCSGTPQRVSIIIYGQTEMLTLRRLLEAIDDNTGYRSYELILADAGGSRELKRYYEALKRHEAANVIAVDKSCRPAALNLCAEAASGELLLFMDHRIAPMNPGWLDALVEAARFENAGAVGARLLYPDESVAHAGLVVGQNGWYGSVYGHAAQQEDSLYRRFVETLRCVSAVSGACMMLRRDVFSKLAGFDESIDEYGFDVELCLRLMRQGYDNIYTPFASLRLFAERLEAEDRASSADKQRFYDFARVALTRGDKFYNPNFDYAYSVPTVAYKNYPAASLNPLAKKLDVEQ